MWYCLLSFKRAAQLDFRELVWRLDGASERFDMPDGLDMLAFCLLLLFSSQLINDSEAFMRLRIPRLCIVK